jgi:catechol 2,3-dioxygenase-like lactoylglutathione lyase family enzyme
MKLEVVVVPVSDIDRAKQFYQSLGFRLDVDRVIGEDRDPDGNHWLLQEITTRLPGRGLSMDVATLTELLRETAEHHGEFEKTHPKHNWWDWYAAYINAREQGTTAEDAAAVAGLDMEKLLIPLAR